MKMLSLYKSDLVRTYLKYICVIFIIYPLINNFCHAQSSYLFYSFNVNPWTFNRINDDASNPITVYTPSNYQINHSAADGSINKVYFYEPTSNIIYKSDYDGSNRTTVKTTSAALTSIAAGNGYLYYAYQADPYSVRRCNFDGTNDIQIYLNPAYGTVMEIAFDPQTNYLYYYEVQYDNTNNRIFRTDNNGNNPTTIYNNISKLDGAPGTINGLSAGGGYVFFGLNSDPWTFNRRNSDGSNQTVVFTPATGSVLKSAYDPAVNKVFFYEFNPSGNHVVYKSDIGGANLVSLLNITQTLTSISAPTANPNSSPVITINNTILAYTENAIATQIDATATLSDADGDAQWNGGKLEVQITANSEGTDEISIPDNIVGSINTNGTNLRNVGTTIGTLSASEGTVTNGTKLTITFNSSATNALVEQVLRAVCYRSTSNDIGTSNRTITFTAIDNFPASSVDTRTVSITAVNDAPNLSATGTNPTFTEDGSAAVLYGSALVSTVEAGQTLTELVLTITNINDLANEILSIDGSDVALTNGNSVTTTNTMSVNVSVDITTATVTISKAGGISPILMQTLIDGITYLNISNTPNTSNRVVTITSIRDNGGTANGGVDVTSPLIVSTVSLVSHNDVPTLTSFSGVLGTTTQNTEIEITFAELSALGNEADVDGTVDAFIVNTVSTGTLKIGANAGIATAYDEVTNKTIDVANNAYWTPAVDAFGALNAFTVTALDNNNDESATAVQANIQVIDITNPEVNSITINGNPTATSSSITFTVTFSESVVNVSTDDFYLFKEGTATGTIASVSASTGASIIVTINTIGGTGTLRLDLVESTNIADASANTPPLAYTSGSVHTADLDVPTLSSSVPADEAAGVNVSDDIILTFSEDVKFGTGNIQIIDIDDGSSTITIDVASPGSLASILGNVLTLNPSADLDINTNYAIQIAVTAIEDIAANNYAGISNNTSLNFNTIPTIPQIQASNLRFSNITRTAMTVRWDRGDGEGCILLARPQYRIPSNPLNDGDEYSATANSNFVSAPIAQGAKVLYFGNDENPVVNVTGLNRYQLMYFKVCEFNTIESPLYLQDEATNNPRSRWTLRRDGLAEEDLTIDAEYPYPNPVSNSISTTLDIFEDGNVTALLFDNSGKQVAELYNQLLRFGTHELKFNLSNVSSGTYQLIITKGSEALAYPISIVQ